jgi:hypothetical protein
MDMVYSCSNPVVDRINEMPGDNDSAKDSVRL